MKKKGFTLIELLAVLVILGIILGLVIGATTGYLNKGRNKSYHITEASMKSAAEGAITSCLTGEEKNREFCQAHNLLENQYEYEVVKLSELINDEYMDIVRDPADTDLLCSGDSYVYIINKANTDKVNNADLQYKVCLMCSKYKSKDCLDELDKESNYNAYCKVSYDEEGTIPYDGKWTDKNLYLTLTVDGEYKYGISYFTYQFGNKKIQVDANDNKAVVTLNMTVDNTDIKVTARDGLGFEKKTDCGVIKVDKEKMISATLTGRLNGKKTPVKSGSWASDDVLLTVTPNPKKIPSGYIYQWYKDGQKIGNETTSNTYVATVDGTYYVVVTNGLRNQQVTTNEFVVKIDKTPPTIVAKKNPISLGNVDYDFMDNVTYTFGISGGVTSCNPGRSRKTGSYTVTCTAKGNNGLAASTKFTARHSYPASYHYVNKTCSKVQQTNCRQEEYCDTHYTCDPWECPDWSLGCCNGCTQYFGVQCCSHTTKHDVCDEVTVTWDCSYGYYTCPNGGSLNGSTCYY